MNGSTKNGGAISKDDERFSVKTQEEITLRPFTHVTQVPLSDVSKKLTAAFNVWLEVPENTLKQIEEIWQFDQYRNILFDDVMYDKESRGSLLSAHSVYGLAHTLNSFFYAHIKLTTMVRAFNCNMDILRTNVESLKNTCYAAALQSHWIDSVSCPTEQEYYTMIITKSYMFLICKIKFMQILSNNTTTKQFEKLAGLFGLYFQILDDFRSLTSSEDDTILRRFSLPIIHAIRTHPEDGEVILDIMRLKSKDEKLRTYVVSLLQQFGSLDYTKMTLELLKQEILEEIKKLSQNTLMDKFMEEYFEPTLPSDQLSTMVTSSNSSLRSFFLQMDQPKSQQEIDFQRKLTLKPLRHLESVPGKNIRTRFTKFLAGSNQTPSENVEKIDLIARYIHEASLLVDDIQDASELRRGIPAAHHIYGIPNTVNASAYMLADINEKLIELNDQEAIEVYEVQLEQVTRCQGMDIHWRDNFICPTEAEYLEMVTGKTSAIFLIIGKLLAPKSIVNYSDRLLSGFGQLFQVRDDYQNLVNQTYFQNKGFCEDISEGKFSFPIVHAIKTHPKEGQVILDILRQRTYDVETKKFCLSLLEKCGSLDYTKKKMVELKGIVMEELASFKDGEKLLQLFDKKFSSTST